MDIFERAASLLEEELMRRGKGWCTIRAVDIKTNGTESVTLGSVRIYAGDLYESVTVCFVNERGIRFGFDGAMYDIKNVISMIDEVCENLAKQIAIEARSITELITGEIRRRNLDCEYSELTFHPTLHAKISGVSISYCEGQKQVKYKDVPYRENNIPRLIDELEFELGLTKTARQFSLFCDFIKEEAKRRGYDWTFSVRGPNRTKRQMQVTSDPYVSLWEFEYQDNAWLAYFQGKYVGSISSIVNVLEQDLRPTLDEIWQRIINEASLRSFNWYCPYNSHGDSHEGEIVINQNMINITLCVKEFHISLKVAEGDDLQADKLFHINEIEKLVDAIDAYFKSYKLKFTSSGFELEKIPLSVSSKASPATDKGLEKVENKVMEDINRQIVAAEQEMELDPELELDDPLILARLRGSNLWMNSSETMEEPASTVRITDVANAASIANTIQYDMELCTSLKKKLNNVRLTTYGCIPGGNRLGFLVIAKQIKNGTGTYQLCPVGEEFHLYDEDGLIAKTPTLDQATRILNALINA